MKLNWNYPTTVWVGQDRINDLEEACVNLKISKPLFVTDKDLIDLPFIIKIISKITLLN
jgi:alcohol dehydrogenase class IV